MEKAEKRIIRRAYPEEAVEIAAYQVLMAEESEGMKLDADTVRKGVQAVFQDASRGFYLAAVQDDRLIGCLLVTLEWSDWRAKTVYWIQSLYVLPDYRRQGVFKAMYDFLKMEVRSHPDAAGIRLYVDQGNDRAIRAYEAIGMNGNHYRLFEDMES